MGRKHGHPFADGDHPAFGRGVHALAHNFFDMVRVALAKTPLNQSPEVSLTVLVPTLAEDADTSDRIAVAEINVTDDALGTNHLSLTGADAAHFEIHGNTLYLKAGTPLDFDTKPWFDVNVVVDDPYIGSGPEDSASFSLGVTEATDTDLDIMLANFDEMNQLLTNDGSGAFSASDVDGPAFKSTDIELGDVDGDGDLDALVANSGGQLNHLLVNDGTGTFTKFDLVGSGDFSQDIELGDLDGDGDLDAVVVNSSTVNHLLFNDGSGNFTVENLPEGTSGGSAAALGDIDSDGDLDILIGRAQEDELLINQGDGTFDSVSLSDTGGLTTDVVFGDVDGDGDLDAILLHSTGTSQLLRNDGEGGFTVEDLVDAGPLNLSTTGNAIALGDLDNDGDLDAVLARGTVDRVMINDGTGTFEVMDLDDPGWNSSDVDLFDFDNDGDLDALVTNDSSLAPNFLYINEDGEFVRTELEGNPQSQAAAIGDVDGDGAVSATNDAGLPNIDAGEGLLVEQTVDPLI